MEFSDDKKTYSVREPRLLKVSLTIQRMRQKDRAKHEGVGAVSRVNVYLGPNPLPRQVSRFPLVSSSLVILSVRSTIE